MEILLATSSLPSLPADSLPVPWVLLCLEASRAEEGCASLGPESQGRVWERVQDCRCRDGDPSLPCFPSVSPYILLPYHPLPRALTQAQFKHPGDALSISTATNLPCSPEMCPLLA